MHTQEADITSEAHPEISTVKRDFFFFLFKYTEVG